MVGSLCFSKLFSRRIPIKPFKYVEVSVKDWPVPSSPVIFEDVPPPWKRITYAELRELVKVAQNVDSLNLYLYSDVWYVCYPLSAYKEILSGYYDFYKWPYEAENRDCDDYALQAESVVKKYTGRPAFGIAWVTFREYCHALNIAVYSNRNGGIEVCFYEPQLDPRENRSWFNFDQKVGIYMALF